MNLSLVDYMISLSELSLSLRRPGGYPPVKRFRSSDLWVMGPPEVICS